MGGLRLNLVALVALMVCAAVATQGIAIPQDDAGSGHDASDDPSAPLALPAPGAYWGSLAPTNDSDWYLLHLAPDPACVTVNTTGPAIANASLSLTTSLNKAATTSLTGAPAQLALAFPTTEHVLYGYAPSNATGSMISAGEYRFRLDVHTDADLGAGDAGSGGDAGGDAANATPVNAGCFRGDLDAKHGDAADAYSFLGIVGDVVSLSLGGQLGHGVALSLVAPSGAVLSSVGMGDVNTTTLNESGSWIVLVTQQNEQASHATYLVGMTLRGPPGPPCRPECKLG